MHIIPTYRFERTAKRTWSLLDEQGRSQGTLVRPKWYSATAEIIAANGVFKAKAMKGWTSDIALYVEDIPVLIADYQWRGTVIRTSQGAALYRIARKHWFSSTYVFTDPSGTMRLAVRVGMNWITMERTYTFTEAGVEPMEPLHVLFGMQAIITQQDRAAAAAA
jgi:hypothetical protein